MTFVTRRADGRFEIRQSVSTPNGPRARTLATFRRIDDEVVDMAQARAEGRFDRGLVLRRAIEVGAPLGAPPAQRAARRLLGQLARGHRPPPLLERLLQAELAGGHPPEGLEGVLGWLDATPEDRGRALHDLLLLADRLPTRRRPPLRFPVVDSASG
jgi:hypothetical protein